MLAPNHDRVMQAARVAEIRSRVRRYTPEEMAALFARRPPLQGTAEERQKQLHRVLNSVWLDKPISEYLGSRYDT
ncbi:hypothetical protein [uncultured Microbacterium sp.]|uniref:hypothetical protein n=1 Tax=uncultured Microbacterium sp. TaxID=191216 RepID=UPI0025F2D4A2|nr:hypothetical protein [uncultured Microbacterium sp.]